MTRQLLTAKQVAEMLAIGKSTVYAYAEKGILRPIYLPSVRNSIAKQMNRKPVRFLIDDVEQLLHNLCGWSPKKEDKGVH